jgi:hypothetical protein
MASGAVSFFCALKHVWAECPVALLRLYFESLPGTLKYCRLND